MSARPKFHNVVKLQSDLLKAVAYDPRTATLDVQLKSGQKYRYREITSTIFGQLVAAKSPGKVFNDSVKRNAWSGLLRKCRKIYRAAL